MRLSIMCQALRHLTFYCVIILLFHCSIFYQCVAVESQMPAALITSSAIVDLKNVGLDGVRVGDNSGRRRSSRPSPEEHRALLAQLEDTRRKRQGAKQHRIPPPESPPRPDGVYKLAPKRLAPRWVTTTAPPGDGVSELSLDERVKRARERVERAKNVSADEATNYRPHVLIVPHPMVELEGGQFRMGVNDPTSQTGEYPARQISVKPFQLDRYPVTKADFTVFRRRKLRHRDTAERNGYSYVFFSHVAKDTNRSIAHALKGSPWWYPVEGATWKTPEGPTSHAMGRERHPVNHVSYWDAYAFCLWAGKRLPTEHEWEYAVRGGLRGMRYPWGDRFQQNRTNLWQGAFPAENHMADGYHGTAPVDAFSPQNSYGFYDMLGNVWEWTSSVYVAPDGGEQQNQQRFVVKGGSFLDSRDGRCNMEARCAARTGLNSDYTAENVGFRCAKTLPYSKKEAKPSAKAPPRENKRRGQPRHHRLEDTWAFKVKQVVDDVLENIKRSTGLKDEL